MKASNHAIQLDIKRTSIIFEDACKLSKHTQKNVFSGATQCQNHPQSSWVPPYPVRLPRQVTALLGALVPVW